MEYTWFRSRRCISPCWQFHGAKPSCRPSFAYPGQQPIALQPSYAALADAAPPQLFWIGLTGDDTAEITQLLPVLQQYDYVALTGGGPVDVPPNRCLAKFYRQPSFQIFAVLHDPGCANTDG